jgi:O-antigen/teichoic acid export membrane protein
MSYQKFTKDIGIIGLTNLATILKGIVILPFITKLLGAENYGIWAQLGITLSLITPIILLGLPSSLVRFLAAEKNKKEIQEGVCSVLAVVFSIALIAALLLIIFSSPIAGFFQCQSILVKILSFIIILECLNSVILNTFRVFQRIKTYAFFTIIQSLGEAGLVTLAVLSGYGLFGAVISLLAIRLIIFLISFSLILKTIGIKIPTFSKIKEYLSLGLPTVASNTSYWIVTSSDRYLIGWFLGVLFVGYYAPAYTLGNIINFFVFPFIIVLPAVLSKLFDENKINEARDYLKYSLKYFLMIAVPSVFGLSILSKPLLILFSTETIAENASYVTPFVALSILLYGTSSIFSEIFPLVKKTRLSAKIWIIVASVNLGLNFVFIPIFGIMGAAITTLLAYSFALILICYFSFKELRFEIEWVSIVKSILASILMTLFILWFSPTGLSKTVLAIVLGVFVYGTAIFLLRGLNEKEISFLKSFRLNA